MERDTGAASGKKIGLIGGLALRAGVFYYEQIFRHYQSRGQRLELVLAHADVSTVLAHVGAGDKPALGRYLGTIANELFDAGAELVAVTAIAPHLAVAEIARVARGPIVNVLEIIPDELAASGFRRVAVFGNRAVMETGIFGALTPHVVVAPEKSLIDEVHAAYTEIALHGKRGTQPEIGVLERAARVLLDDAGAQAILLAGTDLSSFYAEQPPTYPFLDVARLHVDRIVRDAEP